MRNALALGALLLVAAGLWLFFGPPNAPHSRRSPDRDAAQPTPPAPESAVAAGGDTLAESPRAESLLVHSEAVASSAGPDVPLVGTIVFVDEDDRPFDKESGEFEYHLAGATPEYGVAKIVLGEWKGGSPAGGMLTLRRVVAGDRAAYIEPLAYATVPGETLALRARWCPVIRLRVVDAATDVDLRGVDVVTNHGIRPSHVAHPGKDYWVNPEMAAADSPFDLRWDYLSANTRVQRIWARAPGYAWGSIELDVRAGGERVVELTNSGALEIHVSITAADPSIVLRVWSGAENRAVDLPVVELEFQGNDAAHWIELAPGTYEVSGEVGEWHGTAYSLGSAGAKVVAGATTQVAITLREPEPAAENVPLSGTLYYSPAWGAVSGTLDINCIRLASGAGIAFSGVKFPGGMSAIEGHTGLFEWESRPVLPGLYELQAAALGVVETVAVGPEGVTDVKLVAADPAEVLVKVDVEDGDGTTMPDKLYWYARPELKRARTLVTQATWDEERQSYVFLAPLGEIQLSMFDTRFVAGQETLRLEVRRGANEHTMLARRSCGVRIILRDGDAVVPWDWQQYSVTARRPEGDDTGNDWHGDLDGRYLLVPAPGRYELSFGAFEGFQPATAVSVFVPAGEFVPIEIQLARIRR